MIENWRKEGKAQKELFDVWDYWSENWTEGGKGTGAVLWVCLVLCHGFSFKCCFLTVLLSFLVWTGSLKIVWDGYDLEK